MTTYPIFASGQEAFIHSRSIGRAANLDEIRRLGFGNAVLSGQLHLWSGHKRHLPDVLSRILGTFGLNPEDVDIRWNGDLVTVLTRGHWTVH